MKDSSKPATPYGLKVVDSCFACLQGQDGLFHGLPAATLRALMSIRQTAFYPQGAFLFVERQSPRGLFVICSGQAKLSTSSHAGKRLILRVAEAGEALGLSSVIANSPYLVSAETLAPSQICFLPRAQFLQFLSTHPQVSMRVAAHLSMELHKAWGQTRVLALAPGCRAKLAQLLLAWAQKHGRATAQGVRVRLNMTQEAIGETIGASRETVSRLLADFVRHRLIQVKGGSVLLVRPDQLRALSAS